MFLTTFKSAIISLALAVIAFMAIPQSMAATNWLERANEGGLNKVGQTAYDQTGPPAKSLQMIVLTIIRIFLGMLGIIFLVLIVLAGVKYMTASGNEEKAKEAVSQIRHAVIGLLIILVSYSITVFISNQVVPAITNSR